MTPEAPTSLVDRYLRRPHLVTSLVLLAAVVGFVGYRRMPVNLFPDSERPQVAVVTVYPGASAEDVEADVTRAIEKELSAIEQVRRVASVSKDEVSSVSVEFEFTAITPLVAGLWGGGPLPVRASTTLSTPSTWPVEASRLPRHTNVRVWRPRVSWRQPTDIGAPT